MTNHLLSRNAAHSPFSGILDSNSSAAETLVAPWESRLFLFAGPAAMKKNVCGNPKVNPPHNKEEDGSRKRKALRSRAGKIKILQHSCESQNEFCP